MATKYFRVSPKLWHESWDNDQRLLALYLLTCEHRTTEGLFRLPQAYVSADLGWSQKRLQKAWDALTKQDFIRYMDGVVLIVQALKYQAPGNPNQIKAALNALERVPETELDIQFGALAEGFAQGLLEALPHRFTKGLAHSHTSSSTSSSTSNLDPLLTTPQPPAERGTRLNGRNPRAKGTNPRAIAVKNEAAEIRRAIYECQNENCAHDPTGWNVLCAGCAARVRKIEALLREVPA